jgi:hypothetical protein
MRRLEFIALCLTGAAIVGTSFSAYAWGAQGHQVIAMIAEKELTAAAREDVNHLLGLEPGATMASISTWADEHRSPPTASWHFINFPRGNCTYAPERDCPDGQCVVAAIERQEKILGSSAPDEQRLKALKYLVHFIGDVHQPLHAGYLDDKGGNTYQLQAFMRGSNLHAVWDTGLIKYLNEDAEAMASRLARSAQTVAWTPVQAAQESCRIVSTPGFYPDRLIDGDYIDQFTPVMEDRLRTAGARLADAINRIVLGK